MLLADELAFAINDAASREEALGLALRRICQMTEAVIGQVWTLSADGRFLECSSAWHRQNQGAARYHTASRMHSCRPGDGLVGRAWQTLRPAWSNDAQADPSPQRAQAARGADLGGTIAVPVIAGDAAFAVLEFALPNARQANERLVGIALAAATLVGSLISRKRSEDALGRAYAELERSHAELERSNRELERFAHDVAHDLGEPLMVMERMVTGLTERRGSQLPPDVRQLCSAVVDGVARMQLLMADLLEYSRVASEPLVPERVECATVLEECCELLAETIAEQGASVQTGPLPVITAHPTQLRQLFQNLLSNALKYSHDSRPLMIDVKAKRVGDEWLFEFADNGIGIDRDDSDQVFEMFRRLHPGDAYAGTGMGLSICKRIVERHGGRIWVEPATDGGSVFCLTLRDLAGRFTPANEPVAFLTYSRSPQRIASATAAARSDTPSLL